MKTISAKIKLLFPYFVPSIITILFLCITFFIKGVFPFGTTTIANAHASSDLAQSYIPLYTHFWDFLHGDASLFFSFLSGTGGNTAASISFLSLFSPLSLLLYFVPRSQIMEYMSVFLMLKTALMSFAAFYYFKKRFNCPFFYSLLFSVAYALSGYVMMYYVHIMWLDSAILLPFLLLTAENALCGKKLYPFIILFTLTLIMNLYIAFMISLFLLITGGAYLLLVTPKHIKGIASLRFIIGAFASLLMSAFVNIPAALQLFSSKRASLNTGIDGIFFNTSFGMFSHKLFVFVGLGFALTLLIRFFFKQEKNIKLKWFCAIAILVPSLPVIFENINLIWHLGGYFGPANRMGFISVFAILAVCAYAVSKYGDSLSRTAKSKLFSLFLIGCNILAIACIAAIFYRLDGNINLIIKQQHKLFFIFGISSLSFVLALMIKSTKIRHTCISAVFSVLTLCLCLGFIAVDSEYIQGEQSDAYIADTLELRSQLDIENASYSENVLNKVKNEDGTLNSNYSYILSKSALSGWSHSLQLEIQAIARSFGYTRTELRLSDNGGTAFSDAIFGFKKTATHSSLPNKLYTLESSQNGMNVYSNNFTLPFGLLTDASINSIDANYRTDAFDFSNEISSALSETTEPLFKKINTEGLSQIKDNIVSYEIYVDGDQVLYYFNNDRLEDNSCTIKVNGELLNIPYYGNTSNTKYPVLYNNGIITLGVFKNETVNVELTFASSEDIPSSETASFALMSLDKLNNLSKIQYSYGDNASADFNSMSISKTVTDSNRNMLLIPMYPDSGWACKVNSEPAQIQTVLGGFMCIKLNEGENIVELSFTPVGLKLGIIISLITLILTLAFIILFKFKPFVVSSFIGKLSIGIFYTAAGAVILIIYIIPMLITMLFV